MLDNRTLIIFGIGLVCGSILFQAIGNMRVKAIEQKMVAYQQKQEKAYLDAMDGAYEQLRIASQNFLIQEEQLKNEIKSDVVIRRVFPSGRVCSTAANSGNNSVSSTNGINETRPNAISAISRNAEEDRIAQIINECAITTLMLNSLQADIETQLGKHQ